MSIVSTMSNLKLSTRATESSLLKEHLYTYFGVDQLQTMLLENPGKATLHKWGVSLNEYKMEIIKAIEQIRRD